MHTVTIHGRTTNLKHGEELAKFKPFDNWEAVLDHITAKKPLYYYPPMNYLPALVNAKREGGKVRIIVAPRDGDSFWANEGHLGRFLYLEES